jgi:hypothetical protein
MSFAQPFSESRGIQNAIQREKTDGRDGEGSSPARDGASEPGTSMAHPVSEMAPRRTKIYTRTDTLSRKYASTGSGDGGETASKGYSAKSGRSRKARRESQ